MTDNIDIVLLCGGKGQGSKMTGTIPKPMVEIGGKPILVAYNENLCPLWF